MPVSAYTINNFFNLYCSCRNYLILGGYMSNQSHQNTGSRSEAGRKGAEALNADQQKKSAASHKAAETRKQDNPNAFREMGQKGGSQSHGGGRGQQDR
jgi:hypothetical protein